LLGQYKQENARLRELLGSPLRQDEQKMVTQVISIVTQHLDRQGMGRIANEQHAAGHFRYRHHLADNAGQYKQENARLRELLGSPLRQDEQKMVTQVISTVNDDAARGFPVRADRGSPAIAIRCRAVPGDHLR
jgi:cell shape-determining protein MreC